MKPEMIERLEALTQAENLEEAWDEVQTLRTDWEKQMSIERKEALEKFKADGGEEAEFTAPSDEQDGRIKELINIISDKKRKADEERAANEAENLTIKKGIIEQLTALNDNEENIGRSFQVFRDLQEKWRETGSVSSKKYKEIQALYSREIERFFYNITIYKELKENDLKKNLALKMGLIIQMQELSKETSVRKLESMVQTYMTDWDEIGPTFREKWEEVRDQFREATSAVYQKIRDHYSKLRDQQKGNLDAKTALCERVENIVKEYPDSAKGWQEATDKILAAQKEWKTIGFAPKKKNEAIWQRFRQACDAFFAAKKNFFDGAKEVYKTNKVAKRKLIDKVNELKDSTDWKQTTNDIIALQQDWKKIGPAQQRDEQKLWKQFREACDHFFKAKKEFYSTLDDRQATNLKAKRDLINQMGEVKLEGTQEEKLAIIKDFAQKWSKTGPVSSKERNKIGGEFSKALDALYKQLGLDKEELTKLRFRQKVDRLSHSDGAENELVYEQRTLRDKIKKLNDTINQYENNLGFFAASKGDNPFKREVEEKIARSKAQRDELVARRKIIDKALRDL